MNKSLFAVGFSLIVAAAAVMAQGAPFENHLAAPQTQAAAEKDFIARLHAFQKAGDMAHEQVSKIYAVGDLPKDEYDEWVFNELKAIIARGIKKVEFRELFPAWEDVNGVKYAPNLKRYKTVLIMYGPQIKKGWSGCFLDTGMRDGKIFLCRWERQVTKK